MFIFSQRQPVLKLHVYCTIQVSFHGFGVTMLTLGKQSCWPPHKDVIREKYKKLTENINLNLEINILLIVRDQL